MKKVACKLLILTCFFSFAFSEMTFADEQQKSGLEFYAGVGIIIDKLDGLPDYYTTDRNGGGGSFKVGVIATPNVNVGLTYIKSIRGYGDDGYGEVAMSLDYTATLIDITLKASNKGPVTPYLIISAGEIKFDGEVSSGGDHLYDFVEKDNITGAGIGIQGFKPTNQKGWNYNVELRYYTFSDLDDLSLTQLMANVMYKF